MSFILLVLICFLLDLYPDKMAWGSIEGSMYMFWKNINVIYKKKTASITRFYFIMNQLSEKDRQVVLLCLNGIDIRSMSKRLSMSEDMIRFRKERAYRYLRKHSDDALGISFALGFSLE